MGLRLSQENFSEYGEIRSAPIYAVERILEGGWGSKAVHDFLTSRSLFVNLCML